MTTAFDVGGLGPEPAGVGVYAASLAPELVTAAEPGGVALIGLRPDAALEVSDVRIATRSAGTYLLWVQREALRDATVLGADLAHFSDGVAPLFRTIPIVLTVHDLSVVDRPRTHPWKRWARIPLVATSPRLARRVIVPSKATADAVMRICGVAGSRIVVSPYAPRRDLRLAAAEEVLASTARRGLTPYGYVIALGTVEPRKNHVRLVKAFELAVRTGGLPRDIRLVIAGRFGWGHHDLRRVIAESDLRTQIDTLGFVNDNEVAALITGSRITAYVSLYEGFGLPVVEALACGAPTVTSATSSMPEVVGDAGFLVDPLDVGSIAGGLARAFEAGQDRASISARSRAQASQFSWARAARETLEVYHSALSGHR